MVTDRVGDFIICLKNAGAVGKKSVHAPYSKHLEAIAKKLRELGYVEDVVRDERVLTLGLSYDARGKSKIHGVSRLSKPGRRLYASHREAHNVKSGQGARILSTPKGVLTDAEARRERVGGETMFIIW